MSEMETAASAANWFEIPAQEFESTVVFYEALLAVPLTRGLIGGTRLAVFPYARPGSGGAVIEAAAPTPGGQGTVVYLNCGERLDEVIGRVEMAGGTLAGPKVDLPQGMGSFIHVIDPEGNRVGLHGA